MVLDEITTNRLVAAIAISILVISALFVFTTNQISLQVTRTESGWIMTSTGERTEASLDYLDCNYVVSHNSASNTTAISGMIVEVFNASRESANLTFSMGIIVVAIWNACSVEVNKRATLTAELPVTLYESSDHYPTASFAFDEHRMQGTYSFNDTTHTQYALAMEWNISLEFSNVTVSNAYFYYNISFSLTVPSFVHVIIPSTLTYNALVATTVGVVIIYMVIRTWNRPRIIDDSQS